MRRTLVPLLLAATALAGCGLTDDLATMDGVVRDPQGQPVAGAQVRVYAFSRNLEYITAQDRTGSSLDASSYRARVNIERLDSPDGRYDRLAGEGITDANGRFFIEGLPGDALIAIASKGGNSSDIAGMDPSDGTVSLASALRPVISDDPSGESGLLGTTLAFRANFTVEVPPNANADDGPGERVNPGTDPEEEELVPPAPPEEPEVVGEWTSFVIEDETGTVLADATSSEALIDAEHPLVRNGGKIHIRGTYSDPSVTKAFVRIQQGQSDCDDGQIAKVVNVEVMLKDGVITSNDGDFQAWWLSGGVERYQLDLDQESESGNESELIKVDRPCAVTENPMVITLMWDQDNVDVDLYVWDFNEEVTYQGSYHDGERGASSYGKMTVVDNEGRGPEVFVLNPGESGRFCVRAHVFCGPPADTRIKARVQHWLNGEWQDKIWEGTMNRSQDWIDIGIFSVDPME